MKKTFVTLLALASVVSAAPVTSIVDFGVGTNVDPDAEANIALDTTAGWDNGGTPQTVNLSSLNEAATLTFSYTTDVGGGANNYTNDASHANGWCDDLSSSQMPNGYTSTDYDGITIFSSGNASSTLTLSFTGLQAGTYDFSAYGGFYGRDGYSNVSATFSDCDTSATTWSAQQTATSGDHAWGSVTVADGASTVSFTNGIGEGNQYQHGYQFSTSGISVGEDGNLTLTIVGALNGNARTPLNQVALTFVEASPVVPEPTTATLSLLALVGLAARRRRK